MIIRGSWENEIEREDLTQGTLDNCLSFFPLNFLGCNKGVSPRRFACTHKSKITAFTYWGGVSQEIELWASLHSQLWRIVTSTAVDFFFFFFSCSDTQLFYKLGFTTARPKAFGCESWFLTHLIIGSGSTSWSLKYWVRRGSSQENSRWPKYLNGFNDYICRWGCIQYSRPTWWARRPRTLQWAHLSFYSRTQSPNPQGPSNARSRAESNEVNLSSVRIHIQSNCLHP